MSDHVGFSCCGVWSVGVMCDDEEIVVRLGFGSC
jgi:chloramphenicol 3-O-phosphotransferase